MISPLTRIDAGGVGDGGGDDIEPLWPIEFVFGLEVCEGGFEAFDVVHVFLLLLFLHAEKTRLEET